MQQVGIAQQDKTCRKVYCSGCGRYFANEHVHTAHRGGTYRTLERPSTRRCLTDEEMRAAGLESEPKRVRIHIGMRAGERIVPEWHDVWYDAVSREDARQHFAAHAAREAEQEEQEEQEEMA